MSAQGMQHPLNRLGATADPLRQRFEATLLGTFPSCAIFPVSIYDVKMQLSVSFFVLFPEFYVVLSQVSPRSYPRKSGTIACFEES